MATQTSGLPDAATEASVRHESRFGTLELKGAFLWVAVLLVAAVVV